MKKSKKMKKVVSGVLSAVMLVNFCTVMPISAFAKDDKVQEIISDSGHRYQLFDTPMNWNEAETYCESLGGHLATITTVEEQQYIESILSTGSKNSYWLGGMKNAEDNWIWVTNEAFDYRLFRSGGNTRSEKWDCRNYECSRFEYRLTDSMLIGAISAILNTVAANPKLIENDCEISSYSPNGEIILKQNEINKMIDAAESDVNEVKNEIFRLAEMKYQRCTYSDIPQKTRLLKTLFSEKKQSENLDIDMPVCTQELYGVKLCLHWR